MPKMLLDVITPETGEKYRFLYDHGFDTDNNFLMVFDTTISRLRKCFSELKKQVTTSIGKQTTIMKTVEHRHNLQRRINMRGMKKTAKKVNGKMNPMMKKGKKKAKKKKK